MKQKRGFSRYLYTLLFLFLAVAVVTITGSCGGGGGDNGGGAPPPAAPPAPVSTLYIAGGGIDMLYAYASAGTVNGNVAPTRTITGITTQLNGPYGIAHDSRSDSLIVGNIFGNNVLIYDNVSTLSGNVAPTRTIGGVSTGLNWPEDVVIDQGRNLLYVGGIHGVAVFANASTVNGNVAPARLITGVNTGFSGDSDMRLFLDTANDRLYVADPGIPAVMVFDNVSTLNGNVAPNRQISGVNTTFNFTWGITVDVSRNLLYVGDQLNATVAVFANASTAFGNIAPTRTIGGAATTMQGPSDIFIDSVVDTLYVVDANSNQVLIWNSASTVNGNVAPNRSISGANTGFGYPGDIVGVR